MGQANRNNFKTKADSTLRLGSLAGAAVAGARVGRSTGATRKPIAAKVQPSKPIPPPASQFYANKPATDPDNIRKQVQSLYDTVGGWSRNVGNLGTKTPDVQAKQLDAVGEIQRIYQGAADTAKGITGFVSNKPYEKPERPHEDVLAQIRKNVDIALRDNTWSEQEKQQILGSYRQFVQKFVSDDEDDQKALNNWAVQSAYKQLVQKARQEQDAGKTTVGGIFGNFFGLASQPTDDLSEFYGGTLLSDSADKFGPGFILAADAGGWYKIESIQDLQHELGAQARDDPAFAAKLITGMASYGAYGAGTDKYAGQRIKFDKAGNPVAATFNVDDDNALSTFLGLIAKDQEMAMNAQELQPWDAIMDEHAAQNASIGASPGYGSQGGGGGGGYSRYGGGGGGYGSSGGGGVSYTDSDQLKQLINGIARSRLGYVLNDQQIAEFVGAYHAKEAAFVNARIAGQSGQQLDPESQAASWIEAHFRDAMASQQANSYISSLASFLLGGSFGSQS